MEHRVLTNSLEETIALGQKIGEALAQNDVVAFFGDLGAGKTTLIKAIVSSLTDIPASQISSPTFSYLHIYEALIPIYHFDLYRIKDADEFLFMGFDEYFTADGICLIEWSERISAFLPPHSIKIEIEYLEENKRVFHFSGKKL